MSRYISRETDNGIHFETEHGGNLKPLEGHGGGIDGYGLI